MLALRLLAASTAVACWGALALWWAGRGSRGAAHSAVLPAAACAFFWVWAAAFQALALCGAFELVWIVPIWVLAPAAAAWIGRRALARELQRLAALLRAEGAALRSELRGEPWVALALGAVALHLAVRIARALVTPSFGWDDFTYHLYRAGRWVQEGSVVLEPAPDAWTYYEFFPWGGDLPWAWALVWGLGDALVPWVACGIWAACGIAAYALARRLGSRPLISLLVASALVLMPAQITQIQTAYVDDAALFLALAASLFVLEQRSDPSPRASLWLGMSCGLGVLTKTSFLALAAVAGLLTLAAAARQRRLAPILAFAGGAGVALPNLLFNWMERGSPLHPFLPASPQLAQVLAEFAAQDPLRQVLHALAALVDGSRSQPFLNFGWTAVVLFGLGGVGARRMARRPGGALYLVWCCSGAAITALQLLDPANGSMLTVWGGTVGRLLAPSLAAWMMLAALVDERPVRALLVATVVAEYFVHAPWTWPREVGAPTAIFVGWAALCAIALGPGMRRSGGRLRSAACAAALIASVALARELHAVHRYDAYRLFAEGRLDDYHEAPPVAAWPAWQRLDGEEPATIGAAAGWDGLAGHNWFRYPLLGSRLQNRVVYVPVTRDGSVASYADRAALAAVADRSAWLARLREARVDWVLVMGPPSIEADWIRELPEAFEIEGSLALGDGVLARVRR